MCVLAETWHVEPGDFASAARARAAFRGALSACVGVDSSDVDGAEIIFGELFTNALRYSGSDVAAKLYCRGHGLVLEVRDRGAGFDFKKLASGERLGHVDGGRGLTIVKKLARDLRIRRERDAFVVAADLPLDCLEPPA
jgi:anti-sigma regulatory factor (Ser/Thr protein kinase)